MAENKFSSVLQRKATEIKKEEERQTALKKKHKIRDPNVQVVETNVFLRKLADLAGRLLRIFSTILIFVLAAIGLLCIIYPSTREVFLIICQEMLQQLNSFFQ